LASAQARDPFSPLYAIDTILLTRYVALNGQLTRSISALKARASEHDHGPRQLEISAAGMRIGPQFAGLAGLLPGLPALDLESQGEE
jgi:hypothetical protein